MALDIDGAEQAAVDAVHYEYEQEVVTEQQSIERLQDLMFVRLKFMKDQIQASANLAGSASNTPQGGLPLLAERQPTSPSEMPPSPPQSPPPVSHAGTSSDTTESVTSALGALLSAFSAQVNSMNTVLPKLARSVHPNNFSDKKDDRPDRWIKAFVKIAGINGWDDKMKVTQMGLHLKDTAEDWYWENQNKLEDGTWNDAEVAFLKRFERRKMSYALDLQQMQQNPGEKVRAFATRFNQVAAYLSSDKELEVLSFRNNLLPEYRERVDIAASENMEEAVRVATRAEEFMETDRRQQEALDREVQRVMKAKTPAPTPATQRATAPASAPHPPQMNARYSNGTYNTGNNYRQGFHRNNFATNNTNRGSWQPNRDTAAAAPPQRNTSGPPAERSQDGTQGQGTQSPSQHRGAFCQMCGQHGHTSLNCTSAPHQAMVVTAGTGTGLAAEADVTITSQRPANRQGFNVSRQSMQHPAPPGPEPAAARQHNISGVSS